MRVSSSQQADGSSRLFRTELATPPWWLSPLALAVLLSGCGRCGRTEPAEVGPLRVSPHALRFTPTYLGAFRELSITISNPARVAQTARVSTVATPFSLEAATIDVAAGESIDLKARFEPKSAGTFSDRFVIAGISVLLEGEGLAPEHCADSVPCHSSRFDAFDGGCIESVAPDGTSCHSSSACFASAHCTAGECRGTSTVCDDRNPCTLDGCGNTRCISIDNSGACPEPANPCLAAKCDPVQGCTTQPLPDGTECGEHTCQSAFVCISATCVERPVPQTQGCAELVYGDPGACAMVDGPRRQGRFRHAQAMRFSRDGSLWMLDGPSVRAYSNGRIRTVAGTGEVGFADGPGAFARFTWPRALVIDTTGRLLVADAERIRVVTPSGYVTTLAGGRLNTSWDDVGGDAGFTQIRGMTLGPDDTLYVVEAREFLGVTDGGPLFAQAGIRKVSPLGEVTTINRMGEGWEPEHIMWTDAGLIVSARHSTETSLLISIADGGWRPIAERLPEVATPLVRLSTSTLYGSKQEGLVWVHDDGRVDLSFGERFRSVAFGSIAVRNSQEIWGATTLPRCGLWRASFDGGLSSELGARTLEPSPQPIPRRVVSGPSGEVLFTSGTQVYEVVSDGGAKPLASVAAPTPIDDLLHWNGRWWAATTESVFDVTTQPDGGRLVSPCFVMDSTAMVMMGDQLVRSADDSVWACSLDGGASTRPFWASGGTLDGPVGTGQVRGIRGLASDGQGGLFISDVNRLRHLDGRFTLTTLAGQTTVASTRVDGPASQAAFCFLERLAVTPNGLYGLDTCLSGPAAVRRYSAGIVSTVALLNDPASDITPEDGGTLLVVVAGAILRIRP